MKDNDRDVYSGSALNAAMTAEEMLELTPAQMRAVEHGFTSGLTVEQCLACDREAERAKRIPSFAAAQMRHFDAMLGMLGGTK